MKKLLFLSLLTLSLFSCESEDSNEQPLPAKVLGEWETYKVEKQELHLEGFSGVQAIHSIKWYDQTSQFSTESTLEFNEDSTFKNFYANVTTGECHCQWTGSRINVGSDIRISHVGAVGNVQ